MNTSTITDRDKKLLYALGLIVIVALFFIIGIRPMNNKIKNLESEIDSAQVEFDTIKMKAYQLSMLEEFKESALNMNKELSARYYEMMVPAEVDRLITGKALGYRLKVNNLMIQSAKGSVTLLPYTYSKTWASFQKHLSETDPEADTSGVDPAAADAGGADLDAIASINDDAGMFSVADTSYADVYATRVMLDVYGNRRSAQTLLDELITNKAMRVVSYEWTSITSIPLQYVDGKLVSYEAEDPARLIVYLDFYMYDGTKFDEFIAKGEEEVEE
ncbi:MAG: type II secretion system protein M [Lachnospiraceae bacterium]|nr:type II secretion system protein M [Lachnospiraceae bacterium]